MPSFVANLIRPRDLLDAQLEFVNLTLDTSDAGRPRLRRTAAGPAAIVLRLPPQHVAEEVTGGSPAPRLPYKAMLSAPSRIAFKVPDDLTEIPFDAEVIFDFLAQWEPLIANPAPGVATTAIEFPDRLLLVPNQAARFFHQAAPAASADTKRTAIWHSRIGLSARDPSSSFRAVPNSIDAADRPFETTLKRRHRADIVTRSAGTDVSRPAIVASRFMLTALGASATLKSAWPGDDTDLLQAWDHDSESGRDRFVRTAEKGYLFPFGHRATLVKITRRQFVSHPTSVAELHQEQILLVQEEERDFSKFARAYPFDGREMPLKMVRIAPSPRSLSSELEPVSYPVTAIDAGGNPVACDLTMLFVPASAAADPALLQGFLERYGPHGDVDLGNQPVALADDPERRGDANLTVKTLKIGVKIGSQLRETVTPAFLPVMENATVKVPALELLLAAAPGNGLPQTTTITLHPEYLSKGFLAGDRKQVFAKFAPVPGIKIPAERAGGLASPQFPAIDGLSRTMGPVSGVDGFAGSGALTPEQLIGEAKLLGQIPLKAIIGPADQTADSFSLDQLEALYDKIDADRPGAIFLTRPMMTTVKRGSSVETRFLWKPKLEQGNFPNPLKRGDQDVTLILKGRINKSLDSPSAPPGFEVEGKLKHFKLEFAGLMSLEFNALEFKSGAGQKLDVKVDLKAFSFLGDLRFVEEIRKLIPLQSLAGSPIVRPQPDGVVIGYTLPIPAIPLGIFNAQNIALSSSVSISFVEGKPLAVRFALSERGNPFLISMSIFGGTGYFAVEVRTDGLVKVEAAIEFGGVVSLNLFVIKGGIHLLAGIYVEMDSNGKALISGYLRFGGYVDVLDMIAVSIEFYIALTYDSSRNVLFGEGRVTVSVKLIFFSQSFSFSVRKEVPGFGQAPAERRLSPMSGGHAMVAAFAPMSSLRARAARERPAMNLQQWQQYCAAFS